MSDPRYQQLFHFADHVTPYLRGELLHDDLMDDEHHDDWLFSDKNNQELLQDIYSKLKLSHPEAGHPYWLNRTWTLLVWQPVYISFISIYGIHALPSMSKMAQQWRGDANFVAGFKLHNTPMHDGSTEELIDIAAKELMPLLEHYRTQLDEQVRIRPGFTKHLLADMLLMALLRLQDLHKDLPQDYIPQHAKRWLEAFGLSTKAMDSLHYDLVESKWRYVRTTCCMVYRCEGRELCADCPRQTE
ncbi:siderophore ferric iron reductase [Vibrio rumoiensis]|uniref:Siderophore ferric iron reductase n=1 Tax=Vibrio rumoiensis 1S-45 TaxID=1188252 RepID=A0A1E5E1Q8_9VIBR|nr:siderophore ferric iron reductase [Vibrio rumoiensis]OEF24241.1 siderophore ferric iron reductase [Vibrio rumoiensis 1S-45]